MSNDAPFIRPVPQQFPGTALSGAQTNLLGSLSFPTAGGVQAVDKTGAVIDLAGASGVVTASIETAANTVAVPLIARHSVSIAPGAGIGTEIDLQAEVQAGVFATGGAISVAFSNVGAGTEAARFTISSMTAGALTAKLLIDPSGIVYPNGDGTGIDLGKIDHRWGVIYLSDGITGSGDIAIDLTGAATRTLSIKNSTVGQSTNIALEGSLLLVGTAPAITATAADQGIAITSNGNGAIVLDVGAGTGGVQIGNNAAALIGEFGVAPTARSGAINDAAGGATVDAEARTAINTLLAYLRLRGTVAP